VWPRTSDYRAAAWLCSAADQVSLALVLPQLLTAKNSDAVFKSQVALCWQVTDLGNEEALSILFAVERWST